jgi:hypothetical protein
MTRIHAIRNTAGPRAWVAWGQNIHNNIWGIVNIWGVVNALVFAAVLIFCSFAVGCSSEKPKTVSSNNQIPMTQAPSPIAPTPPSTMQAENKPAPKKVARRKPIAVNYTDKTYGVTFEYPRRYALETGDAATELLSSSPVAMNFVQPGGVSLAAVELPETYYANTDFSSAYFNVSVHKNLTADQCNEFAVPQPKMDASAASIEAVYANAGSPQPASNADAKPAATETSGATASSDTKPAAIALSQPEPQGSKLILGDLELRATEAVWGEGTRQSDAKYFHVYQNGACYEFALNVTTVASSDGLIKHVDRDKVFNRLGQILSTVKINPVAPQVTAETPATPLAPVTPAQ